MDDRAQRGAHRRGAGGQVAGALRGLELAEPAGLVPLATTSAARGADDPGSR